VVLEKKDKGEKMEHETNQQGSDLQQNSLQENNLQPWGMKLNTFCMMMYLSQLCIIIPGLGLVLPIVMWATNKDASPLIDAHGKNILNWFISLLIYTNISFVLCLISSSVMRFSTAPEIISWLFMVVGVVGFLGFATTGLMWLVFAIRGAVNAHHGVVWKHPNTITFIK